MKKNLLLGLALCCCFGLSARQLTKEQLVLRLNIVKYLSAEGFSPILDSEGNVQFTHRDLSHVVRIAEDWNDPFLLSLQTSFRYDQGDYSRTQVTKYISAVAAHRVVKLHCEQETFVFQSDLFCKQATTFQRALRPMLQEMDQARAQLDILVHAGLTHLDVTLQKKEVLEKALAHYVQEKYTYSFPLFAYLAFSGYAPAYGYLGLSYELGEGVAADEQQMKHYYRKAIRHGSYWCAYRLGLYLYAQKDFQGSLAAFEQCGAHDNTLRSEALFQLGSLYERGEGVVPDLAQAIRCYRQSLAYATQLESEARLALQRLGETVESKDSFVKATRTQLMGMTPWEMYACGREYETGQNGRYVSLPQAFAYIQAAAERDYPPALKRLAEIYVDAHYPFNDPRLADKYFAKALKQYKKAAAESGEACYVLGTCYEQGQGVEPDLEQAKVYYLSGARKGDAGSAWRLGCLYLAALDYRQAYGFLLQAANQGQGQAMYELARLYELGLGTSVDVLKASQWYRRCVDSHCPASEQAGEALQRLEESDLKE